MTGAEIAALVSIVAAAIYILGVLAVGWPIYAKLTNDGPTALYAVSLVPKTTVVGYGIRNLLGPFLFCALSFGVIWAVFSVVGVALDLINKGVIQKLSGEGVIQNLIEGIVMVVVPLIILALLGALLYWLWTKLQGPVDRLLVRLGRFIPYGMDPESNRPWLVALAALLAAFVAASSLLAGNGGPGLLDPITIEELGIPPQITLNWESVFLALIFSLIGGFVLGISITLLSSPPLLTVEIVGPSKTIRAKLLSHSDGVWHIFDFRGTLTAMTDSTVHSVRVLTGEELSTAMQEDYGASLDELRDLIREPLTRLEEEQLKAFVKAIDEKRKDVEERQKRVERWSEFLEEQWEGLVNDALSCLSEEDRKDLEEKRNEGGKQAALLREALSRLPKERRRDLKDEQKEVEREQKYLKESQENLKVLPANFAEFVANELYKQLTEEERKAISSNLNLSSRIVQYYFEVPPRVARYMAERAVSQLAEDLALSEYAKRLGNGRTDGSGGREAKLMRQREPENPPKTREASHRPQGDEPIR